MFINLFTLNKNGSYNREIDAGNPTCRTTAKTLLCLVPFMLKLALIIVSVSHVLSKFWSEEYSRHPDDILSPVSLLAGVTFP